ncbi:DASS family sodium-coupled anion symporter [Escherichia coli]|nr:DASS family sodium-coupled anion symporter [Escherichia coli]
MKRKKRHFWSFLTNPPRITLNHHTPRHARLAGSTWLHELRPELITTPHAMVGYSVVALMLLLRIICWDDIVSNKAAWNVFFWLASLITLATGLNNTGFISWFGKLLAGSLSGYSPTMVMVALIVVFYLLRYFFASATAYTSALAPMMIAAALAMPEIPLPVFCLMVGAAIGLGSILTPYATGPSPIYYGSGYLPTADYWRLGAIFGLIFLVLLVITGLLWMPVVLL